MAENVFVGQLVTRLRFEIPETAPDGAGGKNVTWTPLFGELVTVPARWRVRTSYSADEVTEYDHMAAVERANVTIRYTSKVDSTCRVWRVGDNGGVWNIVGSPERSENKMWLKFAVERRVAAL